MASDDPNNGTDGEYHSEYLPLIAAFDECDEFQEPSLPGQHQMEPAPEPAELLAPPPQKRPSAGLIDRLLRFHEGQGLVLVDGVLNCTFCRKMFNCSYDNITSNVRSHVLSHRHVACRGRAEGRVDGGTTGYPIATPTEFARSVASAFILAGVPLHALTSPSLRGFIESVSGKSMPGITKIRDQVHTLALEDISRVRQELAHKPLFASFDEATTSDGRAVLHFIFGPLDDSPAPGRLIHSCFPAGSVDARCIASGFVEAFAMLYPELISKPYHHVKLITTDRGRAMISAVALLKSLHLSEDVVHIFCLCHGYSNVVKAITEDNKPVTKLLRALEKSLANSHRRIELYRDKTGSLPLPPRTVETRWGSWLTASAFVCDNFDRIVAYADALPSELHLSRKLRRAFAVEGIRDRLIHIRTFAPLADAIKQTEKRNITSAELLLIHENMRTLVQADRIAARSFDGVFGQNIGLMEFRDHYLGSVGFRYAPLSSAEVERSFSIVNLVLTSRRRNLTDSNVAEMTKLMFNKSVCG